MNINNTINNPLSMPSNFISKAFDKKRVATGVISFIILLICYLLLVYMGFPDYQQVVEVELTEKLFDSFEPPMLSQKLLPKETETDMHKLDDSIIKGEGDTEVFKFQDAEQVLPGALIQQPDVFQNAGGGINLDEMAGGDINVMDIAQGVPLSGYPGEALTGDGDVSDDMGFGGNVNRSGKLGVESGTGTEGLMAFGSGGSGLGGSGGGSGGGRGGGIGKGVGPGKQVGTGSGVVVQFKRFGEEDYHGKDIVNPLIEWMKKNRKPHPYTMRQFLEYKVNDLTSIVEFSIQNQPVEIYLRCTEQTKELAICIVQKENATKLIDQGISERSHKLEIGTVTRDPKDNSIKLIYSTNISPTREKTTSFMSIFLSWWNNGKPVTQ